MKGKNKGTKKGHFSRTYYYTRSHATRNSTRKKDIKKEGSHSAAPVCSFYSKSLQEPSGIDRRPLLLYAQFNATRQKRV